MSTQVEPIEETLPDVNDMSSHAMLAELVSNVRELRALLDPILANPAQLMANMGPMASMMGSLFGAGPRRPS